MNTGKQQKGFSQGGSGLEASSTSPTSTMTEKASQAAGYVGDKAEQATSSVAAGMTHLSDTIRSHEPAQGMLHNAGEAIAHQLESGGRYLEGHGLKGIGDDMTGLIRRNPIPALLIGVGLGALLARLMRR